MTVRADGDTPILHLMYGGYGGQFSVVCELARVLAERGFRSIACLYAPDEEMVTEPSQLTMFDDVFHVPKRSRMDRSGARLIGSVIRRTEPAAILWHSPYAGLQLMRARRTARRPGLLLVEHTAMSARTKPDLLRSTTGLLLADVAVFQTQTERIRYPLRHLRVRALRDAVVIPNGVNAGRFLPESRVSRVQHGLHIGMIARMLPIKDFRTLIRAVRILSDDARTPPFRVTLAGDGPDRVSLRELVEQLGLESIVEFPGRLAAQQVVSLMRDIDVLVHATQAESVSMALMEAYASGVAVVTTDVPGVREMVRDRVDGVLVPPQDEERMAAELLELLLSREARERYGTAARERALSDFSSERMADAYAELVNRVVRQRVSS